LLVVAVTGEVKVGVEVNVVPEADIEVGARVRSGVEDGVLTCDGADTGDPRPMKWPNVVWNDEPSVAVKKAHWLLLNDEIVSAGAETAHAAQTRTPSATVFTPDIVNLLFDDLVTARPNGPSAGPCTTRRAASSKTGRHENVPRSACRALFRWKESREDGRNSGKIRTTVGTDCAK
jgi:hypothetical protein